MTLSVPLTASSIFEELLTLMQLRPDYVPHVEINRKSAPRMAIRILLGRNAIPAYQSAPENLKWLVEDEEPNHDRLECLDQIENLGIFDLLGEYNPGNGNITLYDLLIRLCAEKLEIEYQHLYDIVLCHELSHAATHLGIDQAGGIWTCFGDTPSATVEYFAQLYTHLLYAKKQRHEITAAMQKLASDQPVIYKSYFADVSKDISDINNDLLDARQQIIPEGALQTYQARQTEKRGDGSMKEHLDAVSSWLKHSAESKGWKYFNYSHETDFAQLWEISTGTGERDKTSPLLIDWNGFPDEHPHFPKILEFITPLDWALAVAYKSVVANPPAPSLPQVIIVDRCSHCYPGSFFVEMRQAVAGALPHVKIFSALGDENEDALAFVQFPPMPVKQPRLGQMQALRQAWIGYTVQSGDHHDLSNILGPLVLSTGFKEGFKDSPLRKGLWEDKSAQALLQKIKWSGMGGGEGKPQDKWFDFAQHADKIVRDRRVKVILIDDQSNQGWLDIVSAAVGAGRTDTSQASESEIKFFAKSAVVDVWASTSYQAIKDRLEGVGISDKEGLSINGDQRFKFSLTGEGAEILLLDLRLFMNEEKEFGYFKWALGVAKNLGSSDFSMDEFAGEYTIDKLCNRLKADKLVNECSTVAELNNLLKQAGLYRNIKTSNSGEQPSVRLNKLEEVYNISKAEYNLKNLNRIALEEFYTQETPKSQDFKHAFHSMDCDELGKWIDKAENSKSTDWRKSAKYLELLTLLPRILATIDMSLPIVIFSSTGKREVTEWLKDYRNIITIFNKPGFFGYATESFVEDTKQKFVASMLAAIHILQARVAIQELLVNFPPKKEMEPQKDGQSQQEKYIEIFIDESGEPIGDNNFVVAGIALVHQNLGQARNLHTKMENTSVRLTDENNDRKLMWYGDACLPKRLSEVPDNLKMKFQPVKASLESLFRVHTDGFVSFSISANLDKLKCSGKLKGLAKHNLDSAYLELFEWLIDVVLYEFLPERLGYQSKLKFKIYGATRVRAKGNNGVFTPTEKKALIDNWGISTIFNDGYQSLNEMSFMPLVVNVLSGRPDPKAEYMSDGSSISGAVGFSLTYAPKQPPQYGEQRNFFRHAHYIADLVANSAYISLDYPDRDIFEGFFNDRFIDSFDDGFKAAVDASKYLESGLRVEGFLRAVGAGRYHNAHRKQTCPESIVSTILSKISGEVGKLTRDEFYEFSTALGEWWHDYENPSTVGRLPGKAYGEDSYPGLQAGKSISNPPRGTKQSTTSSKIQNKKPVGTVNQSSLPQISGPFILLSGLSDNLTDDQVTESVKTLLSQEISQSMGLTIDMAKSANKKRVCKVGSFPEQHLDIIYGKLRAGIGSESWKNCAKPSAPKTAI